MSPIRRSSIAAILVSLASAQSMAAQAPASAEPARVLVLGTYHFANPGLDVVKTEVADVLSAPKQAEIRLARDHGTYMRFAEVGAGDTYVGAELLSKWYERNVHMFANLLRIAEPGERILVIVGSGHAPILRELITYHPEMRLVNTLEYLSPE